MNRDAFSLLVGLALVFVLAGPANAALEATVSAELRSARAEVKFRSCGRLSGQQAVDCVAAALVSFSADVGSCGDIPRVAPQAAPIIATAANEVSGATTKQTAVSVLNRVRSVLSGLAAQSSGEARDVYSRINRAFQTAISVINSRG
jgi:hypothetical protein